MQIRKDFGIKPTDKIDKEYLKQKSKHKNRDNLFNYIDEDGIIKLLNSLAYNSKNNDNNLV